LDRRLNVFQILPGSGEEKNFEVPGGNRTPDVSYFTDRFIDD
jgi:hypothetical protein